MPAKKVQIEIKQGPLELLPPPADITGALEDPDRGVFPIKLTRLQHPLAVDQDPARPHGPLGLLAAVEITPGGKKIIQSFFRHFANQSYRRC